MSAAPWLRRATFALALLCALASPVRAQHLVTGDTRDAANRAPTVDLNGTDDGIDHSAVFTAGGAAVLVGDTDLEVDDPDGRYVLSATVVLTNSPNGASETLTVESSGTGLTAVVGPGGSSRTLTITGFNTRTIYEQVLRTVRYNNTTAANSINTTPRRIVFTINDGSLSSAGATSTVFVDTPGACTLTCPATVTATPAPGSCSGEVSYPGPATSGTCGQISLSPASGSVLPVGVTTVTATAQAGASCTFSVNVVDQESPSLSCPSPIVVSNTPGQCGAVVNFQFTVFDNCPAVTSSAEPPPGSTFPVGTTQVAAGARDASGNINFCLFPVTVNDTEKPTVACPGDLTVDAPPGASSAVVNFNVAAADNCSGATLQSDPPSGSSFPIGQTTVVTTGTDAKGNTASCSFRVTVQAVPPTPTPTATPAATPTTLANISTRLRVDTGDNVLIGGFIITGSGDKKFIARGLGPSLGIEGALANPQLQIFNSEGGLVAENDNWQDSPNRQAILDSTIPPTNDLEAAVVASLAPAAYTAIVSGVDGGTGVGLVEVYDLDRAVDSRLANISTRGLVQTGDDVMIGGLIVLGDAPQRVIVRAIGPSLPVDGKLEDPTLELFDGNGDAIGFNDNWKESQQAEIEATTIPPGNDLESAIVATLAPGPHTAIVRGANDTTGVALVEVYALD